MEINDIKPFKTETNFVITDKVGNELNIEYYSDEITLYGTYQATGWDDPILASIKVHLQGIHDALPDNKEGAIPEDFKLTIQAGKKAPCFKGNFNIYSDEGNFKLKLANFIQKINSGVESTSQE